MAFTMPTDRYPWAGNAVERFEYEVRSQMHYVSEKFPLSLFMGCNPRGQVFFFVLGESDGQVGLVELDFEEQLRHEVKVTVLHEVGHYFGLEEHELHALGWG